MSEARRWWTGSLLALLFVLTLIAPPVVFFLAATTVFCLAAWEWGGLSSLQCWRLPYALAVGAGLLLLWQAGDAAAVTLSVLALAWWGAALWWVLRYPRGAGLWEHAAPCCLAGVAVLAPAYAALLALRNEATVLPLAFLVFLVALVDVGAWRIGSLLGRTPLLPRISPGKTRAGFWGGILCALVLLAVTVPFSDQGPRLALAGAAAAFAAVLGDLLESLFKRRAGVKDSGVLLAGHGGILDRIDSLCAAAPVFFACWRLL